MAKNIYFPILAPLLPKNDPRYQNWIQSLKRRPPPWNKGKTKETDINVRKISETLKKRKIDNFKIWREKMIEIGRIRNTYPPLEKSPKLAFLIGMTLGDGNIQRFPRSERLLISLNNKYPTLVSYVRQVMSEILDKEAIVQKVKDKNCIRIWIYQKKISKRLKVITGNRGADIVGIPKWIWNSDKYLIWCLKGLFEAEGSLCIHLPTYTYNFAFSNKNQKLLDDVELGLRKLGFNPEVRSDNIRLRKKKEVFVFKELIKFRKYDIAG